METGTCQILDGFLLLDRMKLSQEDPEPWHRRRICCIEALFHENATAINHSHFDGREFVFEHKGLSALKDLCKCCLACLSECTITVCKSEENISDRINQDMLKVEKLLVFAARAKIRPKTSLTPSVSGYSTPETLTDPAENEESMTVSAPEDYEDPHNAWSEANDDGEDEENI